MLGIWGLSLYRPPFPPADEATLEKASWSLLKDMKRITDSDAKGKCSERARECFQKLREVTAGDPWSGGQVQDSGASILLSGLYIFIVLT